MMKIILPISLLLLLTLVSCQSNEGTSDSNSNAIISDGETDVTLNAEYGRTLVAYFSEPETNGTDAVAGASRVVQDGEVLGNTEQIALWIADYSNSDIHQIDTVEDYPGDHDALVDQAQREQQSNARPALSDSITNLDRYDTIFVGYPIWWADLPMPMYSFFENEDLSGKNIIPFSTHGGSGFANTVATITELESNAAVESNGYTVSRNNVSNSRDAVYDWLSDFASVR